MEKGDNGLSMELRILCPACGRTGFALDVEPLECWTRIGDCYICEDARDFAVTVQVQILGDQVRAYNATDAETLAQCSIEMARHDGQAHDYLTNGCWPRMLLRQWRAWHKSIGD